MLRRKFALVAASLLIFVLTACRATVESTQPSVETTYIPTEAIQQMTAPQPTEVIEPMHSDLYIEGLAVEDVITYFNEVCLNAEFVNSGDPCVVQKWMIPISYSIFGDYTPEDISALSIFLDQLNGINGFPGIAQADDTQNANLRIHFCTQEELIRLLGENFTNVDGGVTFWYMDDEIYDAIICCRTDLDQHLRNSVILEEIYNGLGPVQDTSLREDSIIFSGFSEPQELTPVDELILKLLYHPMMRCGMNAAECEAVIRELYY